MKEVGSLIHTIWDCKYQLAWVPKYRKAILYGNLGNIWEGYSDLSGSQSSLRLGRRSLIINHLDMR